MDHTEVQEAKWSTKYINSLPDSAFLYIHPDYKSGKSKDKSLRYFPVYDKNGKLDEAHVRNALARLPQAKLPEKVKAQIRKKLIQLAKKLGIKVSEQKEEVREAYIQEVTEANLTDFGTGEDEESKTVKAVFVRKGLSDNKMYYTSDFLENNAWRFIGTKVYKDHKDDGRFGRSVDEWVGVIKEAHYDPEEGALKGTIKIIDPVFWEKIKEAKQDMGLSIRMRAKMMRYRVNGMNVNMPVEIDTLRSVDFVTNPSAGGRVEEIKESVKEVDNMSEFKDLIKDMTIDEIVESIKEVKGDVLDELVVEVIESKKEKELLKIDKIAEIVEAKRKEERTKVMGDKKEFKDNLQKEYMEIKESFDLLKEENEILKKKLEEEKEARKRMELKEVLEAKLNEAKLPDAVAKSIKKRFEDKVFRVSELEKEILEAKKMVSEIYESVGYVNTDATETNPEDVIKKGLEELKRELV